MADPSFSADNMDSTEPQVPVMSTENVPPENAPAAPLPPMPSEGALPQAPPELMPQAQPLVATAATAPPPVPRTSTPTRAVNGSADNTTAMPAKAASHGAPTRRYLNEKVTSVLLDGMKRLATEQPDMPLKVLGEYLLQRSAEIEGKAA